jgi:hypothetical protein
MDVSGQLHTAATVPLGKYPGTHWIGGWVDPTASLDVAEEKNFLPVPGFETKFIQPTA